MPELCTCPHEAGNAVCELRGQTGHALHPMNVCPECGESGKSVQRQTIKALLSVSLRTVYDSDYLFCRTQTCPVVYFTTDGRQTFTTEHIRERVYQKESDIDAVFICYCFRHTVGQVRAASAQVRQQIVTDINAGIQSRQCACDVRNPQGSCCLGNVRGLIKR